MHLSASDMEDILQIMNKNLQIFFNSIHKVDIIAESSLVNNSTKKEYLSDSFFLCDWNCEFENQLMIKQKKFSIKIVRDLMNLNLKSRLSFYFDNKINAEMTFFLTELEFSKRN